MTDSLSFALTAHDNTKHKDQVQTQCTLVAHLLAMQVLKAVALASKIQFQSLDHTRLFVSGYRATALSVTTVTGHKRSKLTTG